MCVDQRAGILLGVRLRFGLDEYFGEVLRSLGELQEGGDEAAFEVKWKFVTIYQARNYTLTN